MKNRTIQYLKKCKARKIFQSPTQTDLATFLKATIELSRSRIVKRDIRMTLRQLQAVA